MNLRDFRLGARLLRRDPGFALVAIVGLAVALAMSLLLLGYARYSFTYDSHVPQVDAVYIVKVRRNTDLGAPWEDLAPLAFSHVGATLPGVAATTGYTNWAPITLTVEGEARRLQSFAVLPGFAQMLGLEAMRGDLASTLSTPDGLAITQSAARRVFGTDDVVGRAVSISSVDNMKGSARIAAVLRDLPANTTMPFELLHGPQLGMLHGFLRDELNTGAQGWPGHVLVRFAPGAAEHDITAVFQKIADDSPYVRNLPPEMKQKLGARKAVDVKLAPLRDAWFDDEVKFTTFSVVEQRGNRALVLGLVAVAALLLAVAAFNYVNLATIRVLRRQREIGMRKVLGAGRGALLRQFVAESLIVSLAATVVGVALACLALPAFGSTMNQDLSGLLSAANVGVALALGIALGLLTAIYPSWIAFGVRPARVLDGRGDTESLPARRVRKSLSVLQIATAIALAAFGLAVWAQSRFAMNASPGFDPDGLLVFEINEGIQIGANDTSRNFLTALSREPGIAGVAWATDAVGRAKNRWTADIRRGDTVARVDVKSVSPTFFEEYGIRPVFGRLFTRSDRIDDRVPVVLNELAARQLGFASPAAAVGQTLVLLGDNNKPVTKTIVGIAPDVRFYSLRERPAPIAYELWNVGATITVRAGGTFAAAERAVRDVWMRYYPDAELSISGARDIHAANYESDARLARLLALATLIALAIAYFGAYVVAADSVQRRTREICLRKLFGARQRDIGGLVAREIGLLVAIAAAIGLPLAAIAIANYLAPFTERTPWAYPALGLALIAAGTTIGLAAWRHGRAAVRLRPALALRRA